MNLQFYYFSEFENFVNLDLNKFLVQHKFEQIFLKYRVFERF